jgi:hypothetical protein
MLNLDLAEKYAELKGTRVIASRLLDDGSIVFVLESGPKLTMTRRELNEQIEKMQPMPVIESEPKRARKTK